MKNRQWRRENIRQESTESTSTQASVSIREFELFHEFCSTDILEQVSCVLWWKRRWYWKQAAVPAWLYQCVCVLVGTVSSGGHSSGISTRSHTNLRIYYALKFQQILSWHISVVYICRHPLRRHSLLRHSLHRYSLPSRYCTTPGDFHTPVTWMVNVAITSPNQWSVACLTASNDWSVIMQLHFPAFTQIHISPLNNLLSNLSSLGIIL